MSENFEWDYKDKARLKYANGEITQEELEKILYSREELKCR